jgi:hypothetical protein
MNLLPSSKSINEWSSEHFLSMRIVKAGNDPEKQGKGFADILFEEQGLNAKFIGPVLPRDARKLIKVMN